MAKPGGDLAELELSQLLEELAIAKDTHFKLRLRNGRGAGGPLMADESVPAVARSARKVRDGIVVSNKMDKTAVVAVVERVRHAKYAKFVNRTKRLYAQDDTNDVNVGDRVRVMETRPSSKLKRWRVVEVLERAK